MDRWSYLISALDFHLSRGLSPYESWVKALEDYAFVYHTDDGRPPLARAAQIALGYVQSEEGEVRPWE